MGQTYIAGHNGLVGRACCRYLDNLSIPYLTFPRECDLRDEKTVELIFKNNDIDTVILAAAKVGGINAHLNYPYDLFMDNLRIQNNVIESSYKCGKVKKFVYIGSAYVYPYQLQTPPKESDLLTGPLDPRFQSYSLAKIAGIELCKSLKSQHNFNSICVMPPSLYGPYDKFDENNGKVITSLICKIIEAKKLGLKEFDIWGDGSPYREFLHVDDFADAIFYLLNSCNHIDLINVGSGQGTTIKELALKIFDILDYHPDLLCNTSKPTGASKKNLDCSKLNSLGWKSKISFNDGLKNTINWFEKNLEIGEKQTQH